MGTDSVMHSLFYCQFARAVWLASPLRIHSDSLPSDFVQVFILFKSRLNVSTFKLFLNTLWALWKVRCSFLYEGKNVPRWVFFEWLVSILIVGYHCHQNAFLLLNGWYQYLETPMTIAALWMALSQIPKEGMVVLRQYWSRVSNWSHIMWYIFRPPLLCTQRYRLFLSLCRKLNPGGWIGYR
jgi:hypothetical protein